MTMIFPGDKPRALPAPELAVASPLAALVRWAERLIALAVTAYRARRAERELAAMDDHMLADIGVSRSQIFRAVRDGRPGDLVRLADWHGARHRAN